MARRSSGTSTELQPPTAAQQEQAEAGGVTSTPVPSPAQPSLARSTRLARSSASTDTASSGDGARLEPRRRPLMASTTHGGVRRYPHDAPGRGGLMDNNSLMDDDSLVVLRCSTIVFRDDAVLLVHRPDRGTGSCPGGVRGRTRGSWPARAARSARRPDWRSTPAAARSCSTPSIRADATALLKWCSSHRIDPRRGRRVRNPAGNRRSCR